ncbi:MAG: PadR family transcriptional regulator [Fervidobacterium sp.]
MRRKCGCRHGEMSGAGAHRCEERGFSIGDYLSAVLLNILKESPMHGYEIYEQLNKLEYYPFKHDQSVVYSMLRKLNEFGLLSYQIQEGEGALRKVYSITPEGMKYLEEMRELIKKLKDSFEKFLIS